MRRRVLRRLAGAVAVFAVVASLVTASAPNAQATSAATMLQSFDPSDIISDAVMWNSSTMSASAIQSFLNAQQPTCLTGYTCLRSVTANIPAMSANPMCKALAAASNQTAAQIIATVSKACGVNPQVILVMLQKEQTLVSGRAPVGSETVDLIYRKATGLGCPDTAACNPAQYGLFNQLYGVAYWLVRYTTPPGTTGAGWTSYNWFPVGKPSGVLYNPSAVCGAATITIQNKATAALYYYTPYQPNAAALAAGFGIGDSCSAYGNRNFFLYFTSWFGSTHYTVSGAIATYWKAHGGETGTLGEPTANAVTVGTGTSQTFSKGVVYSSSAGTVAVSGAILKEYQAQRGSGGVLGWPKQAVTTRKDNGGGSIQAFQHGSVYSSKSGTWAVSDAVYTRYAKASFQAGALGWPVADAATLNGGVSQNFTGGTIYAKTGGTGVLVTGAVLARYLTRGQTTSTLGWPVAEAATVSAPKPGSTTKKVTMLSGTVQSFDSGQIIVLGTKTYTVTGMIYGNYAFHGGAAGAFGWPVSGAVSSTANGGGWSQRFANATIYWSPTTLAHPLVGAELALYNQRGGTSGTLGWPGPRTRDKAGIKGYVTVFTNGTIYSSKKGTYAVLGDILAKYLAKGGPGGTLGWPIGAAHTVSGKVVESFEHGTITWTKSTGAIASRT